MGQYTGIFDMSLFDIYEFGIVAIGISIIAATIGRYALGGIDLVNGAIIIFLSISLITTTIISRNWRIEAQYPDKYPWKET